MDFTPAQCVERLRRAREVMAWMAGVDSRGLDREMLRGLAGLTEDQFEAAILASAEAN